MPLELSHGRCANLGRKQELESIGVAVEKTEGPEAASTIEACGLLRGTDKQTVDIRGQLAVEEAPGVATLDKNQAPAGQRRLRSLEPQ
jgi:hypothetical protein